MFSMLLCGSHLILPMNQNPTHVSVGIDVLNS